MTMAEAAGNAAAYSRAAEVKAKLLGHMIDRSEGRHLHAVVDPAAEQPDIGSIWARVTPQSDPGLHQAGPLFQSSGGAV